MLYSQGMDIKFKNRRKARRGRVLLADPFAQDDYFGRSVVYLCEHNADGSFGFVINNYIDTNLWEIAKNFPKTDSEVSVGGPVETQNIFFLHTVGNLLEGAMEIEDGIFMGGNYDELLNLIAENKVADHQVRFFLGYSGWSKQQLEEEINEYAWIVAPVLNPLEIMDSTIPNLWEFFMKREGKNYEIFTKFPKDIQLN